MTIQTTLDDQEFLVSNLNDGFALSIPDRCLYGRSADTRGAVQELAVAYPLTLDHNLLTVDLSPIMPTIEAAVTVAEGTAQTLLARIGL